MLTKSVFITEIWGGYLFSHIKWLLSLEGFPGGTSDGDSACQCRGCRRHGFDPWVGKITWGKKWQLTPDFLPGKFHEQKSLVDYSPWGCKQLDMTEYTYTHTHFILLFTFNVTSFWNIKRIACKRQVGDSRPACEK